MKTTNRQQLNFAKTKIKWFARTHPAIFHAVSIEHSDDIELCIALTDALYGSAE